MSQFLTVLDVSFFAYSGCLICFVTPLFTVQPTSRHRLYSRSTTGRMTMKSTRRVLGHSILRSLILSHRSLIRLLRTARFARALRCAHSFARSLTRLLRSSWESSFCLWNERVDFIQFQHTKRSFPITQSYFRFSRFFLQSQRVTVYI